MRRLIAILIVVAIVLATALYLAAPPTFRFIQAERLNQAAFAGDVNRLRQILDSGAPIDGKGMHGMRPLMTACEAGNLEAAKFLVDQGASVDGHNSAGSALMWAVESGSVEIVEFLILHNVNVRWKSSAGVDAIAIARRKGDDRMIELLQANQRVVPSIEDD